MCVCAFAARPTRKLIHRDDVSTTHTHTHTQPDGPGMRLARLRTCSSSAV